MVKLIPFGIVFLILPESIPLLVMYVPGMVPSTCLKDSQIVRKTLRDRKQREKLDKIRQKMTMNVLKSAEQVEGIAPEDFLNRHKFQKIAKQYNDDFRLGEIDRRHLSSYCRFMSINDYGPQFVLKRRLQKYMDYLDKDDKLLLQQENTVDQLDEKELSHAVEERGMRSLDREQEEMRRALKYWLSISQQSEPKVSAGLLVFSRMFLLNASYSQIK
ncbi:LETM1-like protein [Blakeslea trispora]|nr:LETM1-like protein [Blakeslea trispora]